MSPGSITPIRSHQGRADAATTTCTVKAVGVGSGSHGETEGGRYTTVCTVLRLEIASRGTCSSLQEILQENHSYYL